MRISEKDVLDLISTGESEVLELKSSVPSIDTIARNLAAFSNSEGGTLLLGIQEPSNIVGVDPEKASKAIGLALKKLDPQVDAESGIIKVGNASVAYVIVKKARSLVASYGGYYVRRGQAVCPLTADELNAKAIPQKRIEESLAELSANSAKQSETIDKMSEELRIANSIPRKIGLAVISAIVGALVGAMAKHLLSLYT